MPRRVPVPPPFTRAPFSVSDAMAAGIGEGRLRNGEWERPFHGVRAPSEDALVGDPLEVTIRKCRRFLPVMRDHQFFSHVTAARLWGCPIVGNVAREPLHVASISPAVPPRRAGITGHELVPGHLRIGRRHGLPLVDPASVFLQLAAIVTLEELVVVGDHLILDPKVLDPHDPRPYLLTAELEEGVARHRGKGRGRANEALGLIRHGSESRMETLLRLILHRAGLPEPTVNLTLTGIRRRWRHRADLVYVERRVIVEYDGDHHRTNARQYEEDMRRFDDFVHDGWQLVRVRKYGVLTNPSDTVDRVRSALAVGGRLPS